MLLRTLVRCGVVVICRQTSNPVLICPQVFSAKVKIVSTGSKPATYERTFLSAICALFAELTSSRRNCSVSGPPNASSRSRRKSTATPAYFDALRLAAYACDMRRAWLPELRLACTDLRGPASRLLVFMEIWLRQARQIVKWGDHPMGHQKLSCSVHKCLPISTQCTPTSRSRSTKPRKPCALAM